jgi:hypothetical protein
MIFEGHFFLCGNRTHRTRDKRENRQTKRAGKMSHQLISCIPEGLGEPAVGNAALEYRPSGGNPEKLSKV